MSLAFSGRLELNDFDQWDARRRRREWFAFPLIALLGASVVGMRFRDSPMQETARFMGLFMGLWFIYIVILVKWNAVKTRRQFAENLQAQEPIQGIISDHEITLRGETWSNTLYWDQLRWADHGELVVLTRSAVFWFFPRRFFASPEDWQKFRRLAETRTKPPRIGAR